MRANLPQLTDEEYEILRFEEVRCTGCTPCCMGHVHFLHRGSVIWCCQTKLERRKEGGAHGSSEEADVAL